MLSEGGDFEGGALSIQTAFGPQRVQLAEGAAVVYPASSTAVERVKRGTRLVAVAWAQSMVRAPEKRQVLSACGASASHFASVPEAKVSTETDRVYTNLDVGRVVRNVISGALDTPWKHRQIHAAQAREYGLAATAATVAALWQRKRGQSDWPALMFADMADSSRLYESLGNTLVWIWSANAWPC